MFNKLFFYLFKQKAKTVLYCLLLNIVCTVVIALTATKKIDYLIIVFVSTSFFMNLGFLVNCSVTASKFLKKQTYRLLPMKDGYLYLANTASDFLNGLLLIAIESIIGILIVHSISFNFSKVLIGGSFKLPLNTMSIVLTTISILLLSSFMLYCMLITCLLLTKICMDFLPVILQNIRKFISVIIYIIMLLVLSRIIDYFKSLLYNENQQSTLVFFYTIGIIIIIGINYFLFNQYHEADVNN